MCITESSVPCVVAAHGHGINLLMRSIFVRTFEKITGSRVNSNVPSPARSLKRIANTHDGESEVS